MSDVFNSSAVRIIAIVSVCLAVLVLSRRAGGVRRQDSRTFDASLLALMVIVGRVLANRGPGYRYASTILSEDGLVANTRIKPDSWPLLLSTDLKIELEAVGDKCVVTVTTQSQKWTRGDVFGFYDSYIKNFLDSVSDQLDKGDRL